MAIFITGASGHVGANLLRLLLERNETVRVLVRAETDLSSFAGLENRIEMVTGDLLDPASLERAMQGCDRVFHAAAKVQTVTGREQELYATNVIGTRNVLAAARAAKVKRVVVTSSLGAVGAPKDRPCTEDDGFNPFEHHLPYEESKAWVEHECLKAAVLGQDVVIAISTAVLGPHDYRTSRMGRVIKDFANEKLGAYIPGGFDFVSARDLAEGHLLAMKKGRSGQRYILSTQFLTVDALMGMLEAITGKKRPMRLPAGLMMVFASISTVVLRLVAPNRPQRFTPDAVRLLQMERKADITKAKTELGYQPGSIEQAVRDAYESFRARGQISR